MPMRQPAIYINHGGGPLPLLGQQPSISKFLASYAATLPEPPKAVLVVSAHWEASVPTVANGGSHPLLFDYGGFPAETYEYRYPAKGSPKVADRVCALLSAAGIKHATDGRRGWDHGVFVPLMLMFPAANVPIVQLSLTTDQDAQRHLSVGAALAPLRDEGVLIVGSGVSFHNFAYLMARDGATRKAGIAHSLAFDEWLSRAVADAGNDGEARRAALARWEADAGASAREAHPRGAAEHLMPLFVVAGAGGDGPARKAPTADTTGELLAGFAMSQFQWR